MDFSAAWFRSAKWLGPLVALGIMTQGGRASAQEVERCLDQHFQAQQLRKDGRLLAARDALLVCSKPGCPGVVANDCVRWYEEVVAAVPSVILRAHLGTRDLTDVTVSLDGKQTATRLDGRPLQLDPGEHELVASHPPYPTVTQRVLLVAGEHSRAVDFNFIDPAEEKRKAAAEAERQRKEKNAQRVGVAAPTHRPIPLGVWITGGVGVAGFATFAIFGIWGKAGVSDLDKCKPFCSSSQVDDPRVRYAVADVGLFAGAAGGASALIWYLLRPEEPLEGPPGSAPGTSFRWAPVVETDGNGPRFGLRGTF